MCPRFPPSLPMIYWRRVCLSPNSFDGYEAMGFDALQLIQDLEQGLFTIKTNMPKPMFMYGNSFQWAKYGHQTVP